MIKVNQGSIDIPVTNNSFIMPAGNVTVTATFIKQYIASGTWGRITWTLNNKNLLTISGSGPMVGMSINEQAAWRAYSTSIFQVTVDEGVESIGNYAFYQCENITDITLPTSVLNIGNYAFYGCRNLTDVTIPANVKSIGNQVFRECTGLTTISFPKNIMSIGDEAFYNCSRLSDVVIPDTVTSIGSKAFFNCSSITSITIPENMTIIAENTFCNCSSLSSVALYSNITGIHNSAFQNCLALTDVYYSGTQTQWETIEVSSNNDFLIYAEIHFAVECVITFDANGGSNAPNSQTSFQSQLVTLTNAVPERAGWYFVGWAESKTARNSEYLPSECFILDGDVTLYAVWDQPDLILPDALTCIDEEAFFNCAFHFVKLPELTHEIRQNAFSNCVNLRYVFIPEGTIDIDRYAFDSGNNLIILGKYESYARDYAEENGFRFIAIQ